MFTVISESANLKLEIKSKKVALEIKAQMTAQGQDAKVVQIKEVE